ncbi:MAG: CPBP family intramembrane metalloprotease [Deltaproteobacteria bacterium]|nr:CPBP family intramembrane metalloprotease [Deltaproteobacteria bacterium]
MRFELPKIFVFYAGMSFVGGIWIYAANLPVIFFGTRGVALAAWIAFGVFALSNMCSEKTEWGKKLVELFASFLTPSSNTTIFILALMSSLGEEILFRGAVQNQFGLIVASLLFGLMHFPIKPIMMPWTLTAVIMGFVLGALYQYAGNLMAPILLHFLINFLNIWAINQKYGLSK